MATGTFTLTRADGTFSLQVGGTVPISAWADGYYIAGGDEHRPGDSVDLVLQALPTADDPGYEWLSVDAPRTETGGGCAVCHSSAGTDLGVDLPADQWRLDAHSGSAVNPRFLSMYAGTDLDGHHSPETRYVIDRDYGSVPLPPDPSLPYYGPGYQLDFPQNAGNCATCHAPMAAFDDPFGTDPTALSGVALEGVGCDFCHKVQDVVVDPVTAMPLPLRPGVLSIDLLRPPDGHQLFAGPFDDAAPGEDTFSAIQTESRYCSSCHFAQFWDTVVYDSYGEWLRSDYSDPVTGQTCQECHMPVTGATVFVLPSEGGREREPATIVSHLMPGASDVDLLRSAIEVTAAGERVGNEVTVAVTIENVGAGHHVPTDSPLRQMILLVDARDPAGNAVPLVAGPVVPEWGVSGDPADGYYAGRPGTAYAKVLEELWTGVSPTGAYWNRTRVVSDNRIPALGADTTRYRFIAPAGVAITVDVTVLFRRAFIDLMDQKGWDVPDIVMADVTVPVPP